ncbi:MAG: sensor histidine kinase, partial [Anaerolineales bacterium]|nr:sensor histidine kinase [Anaerolineales bacterium]
SLGDQVAIAIENARLYERSRELGIHEERDRLARELHDSVIQSLCSLTLFSEASRRLVNSGQIGQAQLYLERIGDTTRQALQEMRLLVYELRPPALEREGLVGALRQRLHMVEMRSGMDTTLQVDNLPALPACIEEAFYGIAQEALNNVVKHAAATTVSVTIKEIDGHVELEIADNGRGFTSDSKTNAGMGLKNMEERANVLEGSLVIDTELGKGTRVRVTVKRPESPAAE